MKIKTLFLSSTMALFLSCSNNSSSDLTDTVEVVKYNTQIKGIIDSNCIICHAAVPVNGAPMSLTTYENVKDAVLNRGLIDRISRAQGESGMMPNGGTRLPQATIDLITKWKNEGFAQ